MSEIFLKIINMSISASYIALAVLLLRLLLKKAPKWITVVLWGIVAVRLVCPFTVESVLSLIPSAETVSSDIMMDKTPEINTGIPIVNQVVNPVISGSFTPEPGAGANPLQLWISTFAVIWIVGMTVLLGYTVVSYLKVKRKIGTAVLLRDNIYQSEKVVSPFVLGIIRPKIYLPFNMNEKDMDQVVAHETAHIRRKDHLWKPLGFILLALHWFNPLMWLGYVLLCRDIELACDEKVIKALDRDARADYSQALLSCSVNRRMIAACPLAFGEVGVKDRVRSVLNYKKPAFWIVTAAAVACVGVAVCFLTDPASDDENIGVTPTGEIFTDYEGVYVTVKSIDTNSGGHTVFNLIWHNTTKEEITYGEPYIIERKEGNEWVDTSSEELYFSAIGWILHPNSTENRSYSTQRFDISSRGSYRLRVSFFADKGDGYREYNTWIEFSVGPITTTDVILPMEYNMIYDTATFDIDNDGVEEICTMSSGRTSGIFTFIFKAREAGKNDIEYHTVIYSEWYDLSFQKGADGITRVQGVTMDGTYETHLFDISIKDGYVNLTENGVPIGEILNLKKGAA